MSRTIPELDVEYVANVYGMPDDTPLDAAILSVRTANTLSNEGFTTFGDVRRLADADTQFWPNFGAKSLAELRRLFPYIGGAVKQRV